MFRAKPPPRLPRTARAKFRIPGLFDLFPPIRGRSTEDHASRIFHRRPRLRPHVRSAPHRSLRRSGQCGAEAWHRHAWRACPPRRFRASALCQSRRAEGRTNQLCHDRQLRQPQSLHPQGHGAARAERPSLGLQRLRGADGAQLGRAVRALRPPGRVGGNAARPLLDRIHAPPGGAVGRRSAGDPRRRRLLLRAAARQGPAARLVQEGRSRRGDRRADSPLPLLRRGGPRAAAHRRSDVDPARTRHRPRGLRRVRASRR